MKLGIAVGRNTHTLVTTGDGKARKEYLANDHVGLAKALEHIRTGGYKEITFLGNRRWATPFACALRANGIECRYLAVQTRGERGAKGNVGSLLAKLLESEIKGRPFFTERVESQPKTTGPEQMPATYRLALEYLDATNQVRRLKHHVLDCLAVLFPEVVKAGKTEVGRGETSVALPIPEPQPPDVFGKKMRVVFEDPNPESLAERKDVPEAVRMLAQKSLGKFVPADLRKKTGEDLTSHLATYDKAVVLKESKIVELRERIQKHPLADQFSGGDLITVLLGLLGWRAWPHWRELRRYAGLDVSRLDSTGKFRTSRVRTEIRQYLYLLTTMTKEGRETVAGRKGKNKRLEHLLKQLRHRGLRDNSIR